MRSSLSVSSMLPPSRCSNSLWNASYDLINPYKLFLHKSSGCSSWPRCCLCCWPRCCVWPRSSRLCCWPRRPRTRRTIRSPCGSASRTSRPIWFLTRRWACPSGSRPCTKRRRRWCTTSRWPGASTTRWSSASPTCRPGSATLSESSARGAGPTRRGILLRLSVERPGS
jgi:hypothetical protein